MGIVKEVVEYEHGTCDFCGSELSPSEIILTHREDRRFKIRLTHYTNLLGYDYEKEGICCGQCLRGFEVLMRNSKKIGGN